MYNITLSRLESQPKVKVTSKTTIAYRITKSPDHGNFRYKQDSMRGVLSSSNSPLSKYQAKEPKPRIEISRFENNRLTV